MGILTKLLGGGVSEAVSGVADVVDRFVETQDEKTAAELKNRLLDLERAKLADRGDERQTEVNKEEAKHTSLFVAGWRPSIGWICALALGYVYIWYPLMTWALVVFGSELVVPPNVDLNALYPLMLGLLGLGGMRSFEKHKGVHRNSMKERR